MKNSSRSFVASHRGFALLGGIILCVAAFATVVWQVGAAGSPGARVEGSKSLVPGEGIIPADVDCSKVFEQKLDQQENLRAGAIMIYCGYAQGGSGEPGDGDAGESPDYGGSDVDIVTGVETSPHVTQSETYTLVNPVNPLQIVVTYNDSRTASANYSGASYSSDGGVTFTRLNPSPFASGHGTNFGDPVTLYHRPSGTFHAIFLATGCGGQGLGDWTSTDGGVTWAVGACVVNAPSGDGDRESGWSDINPASAFYGRMYVSYANYANAGPPISVVRSTDNGVTWSAPLNLPIPAGASFVRNVQITGDFFNGNVYIAGMDEGGGSFPHNDRNVIYRSTDGGVTFSNTYTGAAFAGPGVTASGYFACMFSPAYWRHEGWGEPAAYNNVVGLVYAQQGGAGDAGDVYYIRSTDSGVTFGAPFKLNSDSTTRPQWQPNLSVTPSGTVLATWYDARESTTCTAGNSGVPCYRMWSRKSTDNGATWLADQTLGDVVSPLPAQPDGSVQAVYAGDYDYGSATLTKHVTSWCDGRVAIAGASQQDVFTDGEPVVGLPTPTPTPGVPTPTPTITPTPTPTPTPCGAGYTYTTTTGSIVPGTTSTGINCDDCGVNITLPFPVFLYGQSFAGPAVAGSNGTLGLGTAYTGFGITCMPEAAATYSIGPMWVDQYPVTATCATCGVFYTTEGAAPNRIFDIEYRNAYYPGNATPNLNYEIRFFENNPNRFDVVYGLVTSHTGGTDSALTVGVQKDTTTFTEVGCDATGTNPPAGVVTGAVFQYTLGTCGSPTPTPAVTPTRTPTPTPTPAVTPTTTPGCGLGPWAAVANFPAGTAESPNVASNGTSMFVAGGNVGGAASGLTYRYDPGTNTWTPLATMPTAVYATRGVYAANTNSVYVFGGYNGTVQALTQRYNVATNTWSTGAAMPSGHYFPSVAYNSANGKIYLIGGFNTSFAEDTETWEYDPVADTWNTSRLNNPIAMGGAGATINGQFIYMAGNWNGGAGSTNHQRYDIVGNTWSSVAAVPVNMYSPAAMSVGGKNYLVGGGNASIPPPGSPEAVLNGMRAPDASDEPDSSYTSTYIYDPVSNSWTTGPSTTVAHSFTSGASVGNDLFVVAGYNGSADTATVEKSTLGAGCATPTPAVTPTRTPTPTPSVTPTCVPGGSPAPWVAKATIPVNLGRYGFVQVGNFFYVLGGVSNGTVVSTLYRYDAVANSWATLAPAPVSPGEAPSAAYYNGKIYLAPGFGVTTFQIYDIASNTWSSGATYTGNAYGEACGAFNGSVYCAGGYNGGPMANVVVYNIAANTWSAGTAAPTAFFLAGYTQVGQYMYVTGGFGAAPLRPGSEFPPASLLDRSDEASLDVPDANDATTQRLDMSTGTWTSGPAFTMGRADMALSYDTGTGKLYAIGGDTTGGGFFDSSTEVDELPIGAWPAGTWVVSTPALPTTRQANQAGFFGSGAIFSTGGLFGPTCCTFINENLSRVNGQACGSPTPSVTPTPAVTPTTTPTPCAANYTVVSTTGATIVATTTDTGNHTDDGTTAITLPFTYNFYGQAFTTANVDSNGTLQFTSSASTFTNACLPDAGRNNTIYPHWDDLRTDQTGTGCTGYTGGMCGIFTSVTGSAPNRILNIEWRAVYFTPNTSRANFELRLYEGQNRFDVIYGELADSGASATVGAERDTGSLFTQYECNTGGLSTGQQLAFTLGTCGSPTPTPAVSPTPTPVASPSCSPAAAWVAKASMPIDEYGGSATSNGTFMYVAGGYSFSAGGQVTNFSRYDPATNTWTSLAPVPDINSGVASLVYSAVNNKIYMFGGDNAATGTVVNTTRIYDPVTNTWSAGANMPDVRAFMASGYFNNKIYLVGGYSTGNVTPAFAQVWEYDPVANTFNTTRLDMPHALGGSGSGVINGHLYVAGGRDAANTTLNSLYDYNIAANTWATKANLPALTNVPAAGVVNGQLWIFGGGNPFLTPETTGATQYYNPATDTWTAGPTMLTVRSFPSGTNVGNILVAAGGYNGSTTVATAESLVVACPGATPTPTPTPAVTPTRTPTPTPVASPSCSPSAGAWTSKANYPSFTSYGMAVATDGTNAYAFGGNTIGGAQHAEVNRYNTATNTWSSLAPMTAADYLMHAEYGNNGKFYVFGGYNNAAGTNLNRIYDVATNTWSTGAVVPVAVYDHGHAYSNGKIYSIGGLVGGAASSGVYAYTVATNTWATLAPLPVAEFNMAAGVINGKIYIAGGSTGSGQLNNAYVYDIAANSWSAVAPMTTAANYPAGTVVGGNFWVIGGGNPFDSPESSEAPESFNNTQVYDPVANSWSAGPNLIGARSFADAVTMNTAGGQLAFIVGGYNSTSGTSLDTSEASLTTVCVSASPTPTPPPPTPSPSASPSGSPTMQFISNAFMDNESNTATITVTRVGNLSGTSTVNYATSNGTATGGAACVLGNGVDYVITSGTLTFNPTVASQTFGVVFCADNLTEADETVNLTLSAPTGGTLGSPSAAILTINDTATRFENQTGIVINQGAAASPYPSSITVAGGPTIIGGMRITLYHYTANNPDNTDVLLVSPGGIKFILMAAAGGASPITGSGVTLNIVDTAGQVMPDNGPLATADYEPTSWGPVSVFPPPAPGLPYNEPGSAVGGTGTQTLAGNFNGTNANGTWNLYVRDHFASDQPDVVVGSFALGWGIEFFAPTAAQASISGRVQTSDGRGIRNARVTISGNSLPEPRVVTTGSFGYYSFDGLTVGETYVVTVNSQRYSFTVPSRVFTLVDNIADADFIAEPGDR